MLKANEMKILRKIVGKTKKAPRPKRRSILVYSFVKIRKKNGLCLKPHGRSENFIIFNLFSICH